MKKVSYKSVAGANVSPKVDKLDLEEMYAITINPKDYPEKVSCEREIMVWYRKQYDYLNAFKDGVQLTLHPELSPNGRLHLHGILIVKSIIGYMNFITSLNMYGQYYINTFTLECHKYCEDKKAVGKDNEHHDENCHSIDKWKWYCYKQSHILKPILAQTTVGYPMKLG